MSIRGERMAKVAIELNIEQLENMITQLGPEERKRIEDKLWALEFDQLVSRMRANAKKNKITQKDIDRVCEEVRQELYEKRLKSRH